MQLQHKKSYLIETSNNLYVIFFGIDFQDDLFNFCSLFFLLRAATDHNSDNTTAILKEWLTVMQKFYHYVEWRPMDQPT